MLNNESDLRTLEQKIEDATNKLLSINLDHKRVKDLHDAKVAEIANLNNFNIDLTSTNEKLTAQKDSLLKDIQDLSDKKADYQRSLGVIESDYDKVKSDTEALKADHDNREALVVAKETAVGVREESVQERENAVNESEKSLADRHQLIKDLVSKL